MERFAMKQLLEWKNQKNRKPMIIRGARQVGKTWLMKEFGKRYFDKVAYVNFDNSQLMKTAFEGNLEIPRLLEAINIETGVRIESENTLIIFDEVQEVPRALTSLKYFQENAPEYAILAAGSLLGIALHEGTSFPVGKVDFMDLYPLSFQEFVMAVEGSRFQAVFENADMEMCHIFHDTLTDLLRKYYYVGGMPEAVSTFVETHDFQQVRKIQKQLIAYYEQDFSKHAPKEIVTRLQMVWQSVPMQLSKENKKFFYGQVKPGGRAKEFELAIQWLLDCGLVHKTNLITKPGLPLISYIDFSSFKLFLVDVGLLGAMGDLSAKTILQGNAIFEEFKGALTEQYVLQELISQAGRQPYYYAGSRSQSEIDFILQLEDIVVPIEVKAEENLKAKSLQVYCEKYHPKLAVRTSMSGYRKQDWMVNIPLFMIGSLPIYAEKNVL